jgi:hypothetical protein
MLRSAARNTVYVAIDGERAYQDTLGPDRTDGEKRTVGDYITMLSRYVRLAQDAWTDNPGNTQALDIMRKVAGIAVHCMEDHGIVTRAVPSKGVPYPEGKMPSFIDFVKSGDFSRRWLDVAEEILNPSPDSDEMKASLY